MKRQRPTHVVLGIGDIDPDRFVAENPHIRALSYDRDLTVTGYHSSVVPEQHIAVINRFSELGIRQGFNSNSGSKESAANVARVAVCISEAIGDEFVVATSFEAGGRKPGPKTFLLFKDKTGVPLERTGHIGDQWLKDIKGANDAGLSVSVLVAPYGEGDDWRVEYLQRPTIEFTARLAFGLPLNTHNFPQVLTVVS